MLKEGLSFAIISGATLSIDLAAFLVFLYLDFLPFVSNMTSSALAAFLVYFASTRLTFLRPARLKAGFLVISWYMLATVLWSLAIQTMSLKFEMDPLIAKLVTVPISFMANFLVTKFVIQQLKITSEGLVDADDKSG